VLTTIFQATALKANAEHLTAPLTQPITSPVGSTPTIILEAPLTPPVQVAPTVTPIPVTPPVQNVPPLNTNTPTENASGNNNSTESNSGNTNNSSGSTSCTTEAPKQSPIITRALTTGKNQITLFYNRPVGEVSSYSVVYGTRSGVYTFGLSGINGTQNSVAINGLARNTTYYFKIQAAKGCAAGPFSKEIAVKVGSNSFTTVLGVKNINKTFKPATTLKNPVKPIVAQAHVTTPKKESFLQSLLNLFN